MISAKTQLWLCLQYSNSFIDDQITLVLVIITQPRRLQSEPTYKFFTNQFMNSSRIKTSFNQRLFMNLSSWAVHELQYLKCKWDIEFLFKIICELFMNIHELFIIILWTFQDLKPVSIKNFSWTWAGIILAGFFSERNSLIWQILVREFVI